MRLNLNSRNKILISIVLTIGLLISGSAAVYRYLTKEQTEPSGGPPPAGIERSQDRQALKLYEEIYDATKKATKEKNPQACDALTGNGRDGCLLAVINYVDDNRICDRVNDAKAKEFCFEQFIHNQAIKKGDATGCLAIKETNLKKQCLMVIFGKYTELANCAGFQDETKDLCEDLIYSKMAFREARTELCREITDRSIKSDCLRITEDKSKDSDGDGLDDDYERALLTNPWKADSDGDGISDGEEIKNGGNPLVKNTRVKK